MNTEVIQATKNIIINSYIQPVPAQQMFYLVFHYIKENKQVEIEEHLKFRTPEDYEKLTIAFEYARAWFEFIYDTHILYNRQNQLIAVSFGPFIRQDNAGGSLPRSAG